jgi:protein ImuB
MLAILCPDWPVAAAGVPATEPVAVLEAGRVLACSAAARADGVRPGQRRRQAQERCPELGLIAHDPDRDARAFEPVLVAVESLTPRIEVLRPGECAFPARGAARYHGGEAALTAAVIAAVDRVLGALGRCQVGIADGRFAARLAARHASHSTLGGLGGDPTLFAGSAPRGDLASHPGRGSSGDPASPVLPGFDDGLTTGRHWVVPRGETPGFLVPFPVEVLERPELTDLLIRLGLRTLGQVAELPRAVMATRFGSEGVRAHRLATGLDEHPRASRRPSPELGVAAALDPPVTRVDVAAFAAKALADELVDHLERLGLACTRLRIEVETEHGERLARVWRHEPPARPSRRGAAADPRAVQVTSIAERVRWQLDGWLTGSAASRPTGAITRLALVPDETVAARGRQLGFWGEETEASRRAARALARVQGLLGPEAVRRVSLRGGRTPADRVISVAEGELPSAPDGSSSRSPRPNARGGTRARGRTGTRVSKAYVDSRTHEDPGSSRNRPALPDPPSPGPHDSPPAHGPTGPEGRSPDPSDSAGSTGLRLVEGSLDSRSAPKPRQPSPPLKLAPPAGVEAGSSVLDTVADPALPAAADLSAADRPPRSKPATGAASKRPGAPRSSKVAPWPGRIPEPSPAIVHHEPASAEVRDAEGVSVTVNGRGLLSAKPGWLRVGASGAWMRIVAWAGPWPVDERWWDPNAHQRLARLQVTSQEGVAYLLKLADGQWWIEATYD